MPGNGFTYLSEVNAAQVSDNSELISGGGGKKKRAAQKRHHKQSFRGAGAVFWIGLIMTILISILGVMLMLRK